MILFFIFILFTLFIIKAVARSWSGYVVSFFNIVGVNVPDWLAGYSLWLFDLSILSVIIVGLMTVMMLFGVKKNATLNLVITVLNIITILFVIMYVLCFCLDFSVPFSVDDLFFPFSFLSVSFFFLFLFLFLF